PFLEPGFTLCPIVKRIWTPSFAVFSAGWTLLLLAAFYGLIEIAGQKSWAGVLVVVGLNSIAIYLLSQLTAGWIEASLQTHLGWTLLFDVGGRLGVYAPIALKTSILFVLWLFVFGMYRQKIFLKI
ncbi:MAG: DUF5009 domain-containing protein, partial [Planctomycetia bacterium]